jgi:hypothetical protein
VILAQIKLTNHCEHPFDDILLLHGGKRKMNVLFDIGKQLIKPFQIAVVFLFVAFWNWGIIGNLVKV